MALHQIPEAEADRHTQEQACPCGPDKVEGHATIGTGRNRHSYQGVIFRHRAMPVPAAAVEPDPAELPEAACGHLVVDGVHHEIPDDGAPHSTTSECGCGPQLAGQGSEHVVLVHVDQAADPETEALYREVFAA